jgi:hypothetical protein
MGNSEEANDHAGTFNGDPPAPIIREYMLFI